MALASLPAPAARAAFYSGDDLWAQCSGSGKDLFSDGLCAGFVAGIADAMGASTVFGRRACIPVSVTVEQPVDVVKRFLGPHPEMRQYYTAVFLVVQALADAFPCKP